MPNFPKNENFLPPHTHAYDEMEHWFEMGQRKTLEMNIRKQIIRTQVSTIIQKQKIETKRIFFLHKSKNT